MTNQTSQNGRARLFSGSRGIFIGVVITVIVLLLLCILVGWMIWYFPLDPISPPPTEPGNNSEFDELLSKANQWELLFRYNKKIIVTDIYGKEKGVILDIEDATGNKNAEILFDISISPDEQLLIVNYFVKRKPEDPPIDKLLLVGTTTGITERIHLSLPGYKLDAFEPVYWLSNDVFLAKMVKYFTSDDGVMLEAVTFLRYDLQNKYSTESIEFPTCRNPNTKELMERESLTLLVMSPCEQSIYAIDIDGKRLATSEETAYFNSWYRDCGRNASCFQHLLYDTPTARIERVIDYVDGFGRYFENNWFRYNIYLEDKLVRISDGVVEKEPLWDRDLHLFVWSEGVMLPDVYVMDEYGHYRYLRDGRYAGKISRDRFK